MKENIIKKKSFDFAIRIVKLFQHLQTEKREFVLSKQLLRFGTSIGANVEEAIGGQSEKDFFAKLTIAYKEARETKEIILTKNRIKNNPITNNPTFFIFFLGLTYL